MILEDDSLKDDGKKYENDGTTLVTGSFIGNITRTSKTS